jgi:acyl carrier protein
MNVEEKVCAIVARQLGLARVAPQARLIEDLGAESLDIVTIGAALEAAFGRPFSDEALFGAETAADLARSVSDQ